MAKSAEELTWKDLEIGAIITEPGNASQYQTGSWRTERPIIDLDKCTKCGLCYVFCPDMAIKVNDEGYPETDLFYCKGCGICVAECPKQAITMLEEEG